MLDDIRYALRGFRRNPGFTAIALLCLSLGIGASTAVFSLVNAALLKPLPYPNADRIVFPWRQAPKSINLGYNEVPWNLREAHSMRKLKSFQEVGAFVSDYFNLTGSGEPARLDGVRASTGFFHALGVSPQLGRVFTADEDQPGHEHEVILSDRLWHERFGADQGILGRALELGGASYTVVGVMPPRFEFPRAGEMPQGFEFPRSSELWVPLALPAAPLHSWDPDVLAIIALLRPGVSVGEAQAEMDVYASNLEIQYKVKGWFSSRVTPIAQQTTGDTRQPLLLILGAVGIVLLIACANVASLALARSLGRRHEFTLRAALGAGNGRLLRQVLTESVVLAAIGGIGGMFLANAGIQLVKTFGPANLTRLGEATLDPGVFAFALVATLVAAVVCGLTPAIFATRHNLADSLKEGGRRSTGNAFGQGARKALVVAEIALAMVLVIAAGLLTRTFVGLYRVDPGYRPAHVLTFELSLPQVGSSTNDGNPSRAVTLYTDVLRRLRTVPGVESVGIAKTIPLGGAPDSTGIRIPDRPVIDKKQSPFAAYNLASPGYFSAVGNPILRGREIADSDLAPNAPPVVVINRTMAETYWPGQDAIGKQVGPGSLAFPLMTIVGIAADAKDLSMRQIPGPEMYVPYHLKTYVSLLTMQAVVRTKADPLAMARIVEAAIHEVDPGLPIAKVSTMETLVDASIAQPKFVMLLLAAFGIVGLVLAAIGMYGVISYSVAQRTREIGLRVALGARPGDVFGMVLGQGGRLAALGIGIGLIAALAATRLMESFLYGVRANDSLTLGSVAVFLLAIAMAACYLPARRAMRVDPMEALRHD